MLLPWLFLAWQPSLPPPTIPREFRGVWVATVDNVDWPSKPGLSSLEAQAELTSILDRAKRLNLNAVFLQVRPCSDAMYPSQMEPWSSFLTGTQGRPPDPFWDPLAFAVREAHSRGLQLHAWINPFRAWRPTEPEPAAFNFVGKQNPGWVKPYAGLLWMDPGITEVRSAVVAVVGDILEKYDVDGIHVDDYFYPYPSSGAKFPDDSSFGSRGASRSAWRRANVDDLIKSLDAVVHKVRPWAQFTISPFGISRPGVPRGVRAGFDQYEDVAADPAKWMRQGWCDALIPQIYWKLDSKNQPFLDIARYWTTQNPHNRRLYIGLNASQTIAPKPWPSSEIVDQVIESRNLLGTDGFVLFSAKPLLPGYPLGDTLLAGPFAGPALPPPTPWLGEHRPSKPIVSLATDRGATILRFALPYGSEPARAWVVWARKGPTWTMSVEGDTAQSASLAAPTQGGKWDEFVVCAEGRTGLCSPYATIRTAPAAAAP